MDTLEAVASSASTSVLLTGESGVGKEVAAHIVHQRSPRSEGAFVTLNVACLPENLVESELFGHEAGAFTGAQKRKRGVFELADDGTLFLDEIGELPTSMQAKLLRVLEGHPFRRLGGEEEIQPNFRLVTATNRDLSALVEAGDFRQDLYHRLRILEVELPPLRERSGDIKKLALYFLAVLGDRLGRPDVTLTAEALECLENYTWPGNIRELRNVIERALVLTQEGPIRPESFPAEVVEASPRDLDSTSELVFEDDDESDAAIEYRLREEDWELDTLIHLHIQRVLEHCDGNITRAAEKLGITRQTVRRRLDRYEEN
jgi:transcriptional regulator with GAF, ATPase, and Fis domain